MSFGDRNFEVFKTKKNLRRSRDCLNFDYFLDTFITI
nr:MAG TPA: hypothetical protein [Caudoviricetes sp.]